MAALAGGVVVVCTCCEQPNRPMLKVASRQTIERIARNFILFIVTSFIKVEGKELGVENDA